MKIGIFGGCFNPPHNMHKDIPLELIEKGYLDKVIYVPTGDYYPKKDLIEFKHRYNMINLMIENNENLLLSDISSNTEYQYTYQVLDYFNSINKNDDIYFICGTDNLNELDMWRNYEYILKKYKLLVIKRNNDDLENILNKYEKYKKNIIIANIESRVLSSTLIRDNINSDEIKKYLQNNVYSYIIENKLYKGDL